MVNKPKHISKILPAWYRDADIIVRIKDGVMTLRSNKPSKIKVRRK